VAFRQSTSKQEVLARPYETLLRLGSRQVQQAQRICPKILTNISMKKPDATPLVVADTSGLMSLLVDTDANHHKALTLSTAFDENPGAVVISSHVFTELMNVLGKKLGHQVAVSAGQQIIKTAQYVIMESDEELSEALERFAHQPASVSYTDCIVIALADWLGTKLIFGFDEVFEKNGYQLPTAPKTQQAA
jgi:predicted nucleic acid-binding protein